MLPTFCEHQSRDYKLKTEDSNGNSVTVGDSIKVLEIDERITQFLPDDEKAELAEFIGNVFEVLSINSDGSMVVTKTWSNENIGEIMGHEIAIFPKGALLA